MCGIAGILSSKPLDKAFSNKLLSASLEFLKKRGPDDSGLWCGKNIGFGHARLSIIDLSLHAHQPMSYADGKYVLSYNGEIYNYLELKQELTAIGCEFSSTSDTEVLLAAYDKWGVECLQKFRGMFAFALWDNKKNELFVARDRFGEKPFFYSCADGKFFFASTIKALMSLNPAADLSPEAVDLFLHYHYIPEPLTPFKEIMKLPAAHYMLLSPGNLSPEPQRYWNIEDAPVFSADPVERIREELFNINNIILRSDVPVGIALSGGIDSGALAALAAHENRNDIKTFCIGYPGRPSYDERGQAQALAHELKLPFAELEIESSQLIDFFPGLIADIDEPIADISAFGHYSVMKLASEHGVKVMLSGLGGDELFWGYRWPPEAAAMTIRKKAMLGRTHIPFWLWRIMEKFVEMPVYQSLLSGANVPSKVRKWMKDFLKFSRLAPHRPDEAVYENIVPDFNRTLCRRESIYTTDFLHRIPNRNPFSVFKIDFKQCDDIPLRICSFLFDSWFASKCLPLGDKVSMANSVEMRLPFADWKLAEIVTGARKNTDDYSMGGKHWLKAALKGILPDEVLNRPKRGFQPPGSEWIHALIKKYGNLLKDGYMLRQGIFSEKYVEKILKNQYRYTMDSFIIYKMLVFELWYRKTTGND